MTRLTRSFARWPRQEELLLVRAALLDGQAGLAAWRQFRQRHAHIGDLEPGAYGWLQQLFCNLEALDAKDHERGLLKGIYRREWYANQRLMQEALDVSRVLGAAGIDVMLFGGCALVAHLPNAGARPLDRIDILVRSDETNAALRALTAIGWTQPTSLMGKPLSRFRSSLSLVGADRCRLELHRSAAPLPKGDHLVWTDAARVVVQGVTVRTPSLADQLLIACAGGMGWAPAGRRWIMDAMLILRASAGRPDWPSLVQQAHERKLSLDLADGLDFLAAELSVQLPPEVRTALRASTASASTRVRHEIKLMLRPVAVIWRLARHAAWHLKPTRVSSPPSGSPNADTQI